MLTFVRGNIRFELKLVTQEQGRDQAIFEWDCFPPPKGYEKRFQPPVAAAVLELPEFLQPDEQDRLVQAARSAPDEALTWTDLLIAISAAFDFTPFPYDLSKIPDSWRRSEPCYDTKIVVVATHVIWEITARATIDLQFGAVTIPADDVVAVFRLGNPNTYRFMRRFHFNPKCCPDRAPDSRFPETAGETIRNVLERGRIEQWEFRPRFLFEPNFRLANDTQEPDGPQ